MGEKEKTEGVTVMCGCAKIECGTTNLPEVEPVENLVEYVKKSDPTEYEFEIPLETTMEELAAAVNGLSTAANYTAQAFRIIERDVKIMLFIRLKYRKQWYLSLHAKKERTRKKYRRMLQKYYLALVDEYEKSGHLAFGKNAKQQ